MEIRVRAIAGVPASNIWRYRSLALARAAAGRRGKMSAIVLGDHPEYWLVRPSDAARLERAGYEILEYI